MNFDLNKLIKYVKCGICLKSFDTVEGFEEHLTDTCVKEEDHARN